MIGSKEGFRNLNIAIRRIAARVYWETTMLHVANMWSERPTRWAPWQNSMRMMFKIPKIKSVLLGEIEGIEYYRERDVRKHSEEK